MGASVNKGLCVRPAVFGCALHSEKDKRVDVHLKWARYRKSYMTEFFKDQAEFMEHLNSHQTAVESLIPSTLLERNRQEVLRTQDFAVLRVQLDSVDLVAQLGNELTDDNKWCIMVTGTKDQKPVCVVFSLSVDGAITAERIPQFEEPTMQIVNAVAHGEKLLVQTKDKFFLFNYEYKKAFSLTNQSEIRAQGKLLGV
jgi:hypothetical protein